MVNANHKIGTVINGRYEITGILGSGASAGVFRAKDKQFDRDVALKILAPDENDLRLNTRAFETEVKAITDLSHDHNAHIVEIYDVSLRGEERYIVMEYVEGVTLRTYMDRHPTMSFAEICNCAEQILYALRIAHKKGIVHRDIKPQNVIVTNEGKLKVTDFGIAKLAHSDNFKLKDRAVGSVHYISPEQANGDETDRRSDLYSLGILMYEMATGRLPFDGPTADVILQKQLMEMPKTPKSIRTSIPLGLEQIILTALEKEPDDRFRSADVMLEKLHEVKKNPDRIFDVSPADTEPARTEPKAIRALEGVTALLQKPIRAIEEKLPKTKKGKEFLRNVLLIASGGLAVLILTLIIVLNSAGGGTAGPLPSSVNKGQTYSDTIAQELRNAGYNPAHLYYEYSSEPAGTILKVEQEAGTQNISLHVSVGPAPAVETSLSGYFADVKTALDRFAAERFDSAFTYKISYKLTDAADDGMILSWKNGDGEQTLYDGATLHFTVGIHANRLNALVGLHHLDAKAKAEQLFGMGGVQLIPVAGGEANKVTAVKILADVFPNGGAIDSGYAGEFSGVRLEYSPSFG